MTVRYKQDRIICFAILIRMEKNKTDNSSLKQGSDMDLSRMAKLDLPSLLEWYRKNRRDLPFRKQRDPYKIWISEIMSQQTRIEAMLGYYENFIHQWPDLPSLAQADDDQLHKAWQGLGYYSRARNLKKAAQVCVANHQGKLPETKAELKKLPGIGDYTAGAIASIANNERCTAIDGNVIRVLARYYWLDNDFFSAREKKKLEQILTSQLPASEDMPDFTQALMELGARICMPKKANCSACPLKNGCAGARQADPLELPKKKVKAEKKTEDKIVVLLAGQKEGQWYLHIRKRPDTGLLAGLYEFDSSLKDYEESRMNQSSNLRQSVARLCVEKRIDLGEYSHVFSHKIWNMKGELLIVAVQDDFVSVDEIEKFSAIPSAFMPFYQRAVKILETLAALKNQPHSQKMDQCG